jgi:hypothetical protein
VAGFRRSQRGLPADGLARGADSEGGFLVEQAMDRRFSTYEEFWPFYVSQHLHPVCRALHFVGTTCVLAALAAAVLRAPGWLLCAPLAGYGFAWIGHFFFERNRPATFTYPLWSLRGDFRMYRLTLLGRMPPELRRASERFPARG